jgi:pyruvate formate lyase activating enzyme
MIIGGLQKTTLIDYPGKLAATIFLLGCNFRCPWCYSKELVLPEEIKKHPRISEKYILDFLKGKKGLLEGVVVCGGEPTLQNGLPDFCRKIKNLGYSIKLDTNGSNSKILEKLIKERLINYIALDIKSSLKKEKYKKATGGKADIKEIIKSIKIIKKSGIDFEFRTTIVPGVHNVEDVEKIAKEIKEIFKEELSEIKYFLQNFRSEKTIDRSLEKQRPYSDELLEEMKKSVQRFIQHCEIR